MAKKKLFLIRKQTKEIEYHITTNTDVLVISNPMATKLPAVFHLLELWNASFLELIGEDIQIWKKNLKG